MDLLTNNQLIKDIDIGELSKTEETLRIKS